MGQTQIKANITFTKTEKKNTQCKINGNHPTKQKKKKRKKERKKEKQKRETQSQLETRLNMAINKHQWTECSNQKTQSGRLD